MTAERITPQAVAAELDVLDQEARVVAGELVVTIGFTNAAVKTLAPREWEEVAAYLHALLGRAPLKASPAYAAHRVVLGALASELRGFAAAAGEPVGAEADLRAAGSQAEERRVRERLADQAAAFDRHVDEVVLEQAARHAYQDDPYLPGVLISDTDFAERGIGTGVEIPEEEDPTSQPVATPPAETADDVLAWL